MTASAANETDVIAELVIPTCSPTTVARAPELALLMDRLRAALAAIVNAGSLEHRRGAVAMRHLEFEIAPVLETLDLDYVVKRIFEAGAHDEQRRPCSTCQGNRPGGDRPRVTALIPVDTGRLYPGHTTQVTIPSQPRAIRLDRFQISPTLAQWFAIDDIRINEVPQLEHSQSALQVSAVRLNPAVIPAGAVINIIIRYTGNNGDGMSSTEPLAFHGVLLGELADHEIRFQSNIGVSRSMGATTIRPQPCAVPFDPTRLSIPHNIAHLFVVESMLIDNGEQFVGERHGAAFSSVINDAAPTYSGGYDHCQVGSRVELRVRYTGPIEGGQLFEATLSGPIGDEP